MISQNGKDMKVKLSFDLNDSDEKRQFQAAVDGMAAHLALWDMDQFLRSKIKYGNLPEEVEAIYEEIREKLREVLNENSVDLDEVL